jgi:tyrosyl-tRNA synthetase
VTVTDSSPPPSGRDSLTDDLLWRGLIQDSTGLDELRELLDGGTATT